MLEGVRRLYPAPFGKLPAFFDDITRRYGDVVAFPLPGRYFVLLNHPDQIKDVLVTRQHAFVKSFGARTLRYLLGNGLLTSEEPQHRQMRRIVQPAFHHQRIAQYAATMIDIAHEWVGAHRNGDRFDVHAAMSELTLRIASVTLFGVDASDEANEVRAALHTTLEAYPAAVSPFALVKERLGISPVSRAFGEARERLDRVIYSLIAQRRAEPGGRHDALSMLLEASDPDTGYRLSDEQVRDEAMTLFLAGHETTANALTWTWYLLARHPEIEARMHAEVDALSTFADPFAALEALPYTRRVLRESMRLYPPAWIIGRENTEAVTLTGGYELKRGTTAFVSALTLHRNPAFYPDPLRFNPDRWIAAEVPPYAYLPFGGGARRCIGEEFAWAEGTLVLAALAKRFRFVLETDRELELQPLVTLRPKGPVPIRLVERSVQQA